MAGFKVHRINPFAEYTMPGWHATVCGRVGSRDKIISTEYITVQSNRFEARIGPEGVTCKRCITSPAPHTDGAKS